MSEVLTFDQWVETDEAKGLDGLKLVQGYGDHYRYNSFAAGNHNPAEAAQVDASLFTLARNSGYIDAEDDEVAEDQYFGRSEPVTDEKLARVVSQKFYDKEEGEAEVRDYLTARNTPGFDPERLSELEEGASPYIDAAGLSKADKAAALRGDQPFAVTRLQTEEGERAEIVFDPDLDESSLTDERIAQVAKQYGISSRDLPMVRKMLETPNGLTVSRAKALRNAELRDIVHKTEDEDLQFYRDQVVKAVAEGRHEYAQELASNAARGALAKEYSGPDIVNALVDHAKFVSVSDEPQFLSTGEVVMPAVLHARKKEFDAAVNALDISEEQKNLTKQGRDTKMLSLAAGFHKLASSFGGEKYVQFYEEGKAAGHTDAQIAESWFSDADNFEKGKQMAEGTFFGFVDGFAGLIMYPLAVSGDERARETAQSLMDYEQSRHQYASTFGEDLGIGYSIARTAPSVAADIALAIPTGGALGAASAGTKWTMKQGAKLMLRDALSTTTKAATQQALKRGTAGSVAQALKMTGDDVATKLSTFTRQSLAIAPTAFNRSAGATYTSVYSSLETQNPDWSPGQIREAAYGHAVVSGAITVGITSAFNGLAQAFPKYFGAGVEEWATGRGGKLTIRQLRTAYQGIAKTPHRIPKEIRNYIKLDTFEEFVGSLAKEGMRNSWLAHAGRNVASEAVEEGLDEFVNGWRQSAFLNEDVGLLDHLRNAGHAAVVGGVFGVGGAVHQGGIRTKISDKQQREFESGAFGQIAEALDISGNVESASVLRGLVARAGERRVAVSRQLEEFGRFSRRQENRIGKTIRPWEKILSADPRVPSGMQRELRQFEEFIAKYEGIDPAKLTDRARVQLAAARIGQRRVSDAFNKAELAAVEGTTPVTREEGAVTNESGEVVAVDRGTRHREFAEKYKAETKDEADAHIETIHKEISRLGSRGDQVTPYQNERIKYLSEQRDALRAQFAEPADTGAQTQSPARQAKAKPSKLETALRNVESGLGALRALEARNPAVRNTPAHRARKVALRSRRRSLREALANGAGPARKPVSWRQYPVAKIAEQFLELDGTPLVDPDSSPAFDPATNQNIDIHVDPEAAVAAIEDASKVKRKMDEATVKKLEKGTNVTDAELESLATEDPDIQYAEKLSILKDMVASRNALISVDHDTPNPDKVRKIRAQEVALEAARRVEVDESIDLIPEEVVEAEVEAIAKEVSESSAGPEPRTARYVVDGTRNVLIVTDDKVRVLDRADVVEDIPATSFEEADAIAQKWVSDNGIEEEKVTRTETETDPQTEADATVASGDLSPIEADVVGDTPPATDAESELEEDAKAEYIAAELEAIQSKKTVAEVLEEKIKEEKQNVDLRADVAPILSSFPTEGNWTVEIRGGLIALKNFDASKHQIASPSSPHYKKGDITILSRKTGRPIKSVEVRKLTGEGVTLYDGNGVPQFARPEDEALFNDLVERGVEAERRSFGKGKRHQLYTHNLNYLLPFLRTLWAEIQKRYPSIDTPPSAMFKSDPDPSLMKQSLVYQYFVTFPGSGDASLTRTDLLQRRDDLVAQLTSGTKKGREGAAVRRAEEKLTRALNALEEAEGLHEGHSAETDEYYSILQKKAQAEARVGYLIDRLARLNEVNRRQLTEDEAEVHKSTLSRASRDVSEAEAHVVGLSLQLEDLTDPRTLPNLSSLEGAVVDAHHALADAKRRVKAGEFSAAAMQQRISDIDEVLLGMPHDTSYAIEFKKGDVPLTSRTQRRLEDIHKGHDRRSRKEKSKAKLSRQGQTVNSSIPLVETVVYNEDGTETTTQEVVFTNTPLEMAEALNLGYQIRVPSRVLKSGTVNPSIKVDGDGYISEVYHPTRLTWVRKPGELTEYAGEQAFTPGELTEDHPRMKYVGSLPPVRYADLPHLGKTPLGIEADRVQSVYHPETTGGDRRTEAERQQIADEHGIDISEVPEFTPQSRQRLGSPDEEYIAGAQDFLDGKAGGNRMAAPRSRVSRVKGRAAKEYNRVVGPIRRQLDQLRALQDNEQISTNPIVPADLAQDLGSVDVIGLPEGDVEINEAQLDTLTERAEQEVTAAQAELDNAKAELDKALKNRRRRVANAQRKLDEVLDTIATHIEDAPDPASPDITAHREQQLKLEEQRDQLRDKIRREGASPEAEKLSAYRLALLNPSDNEAEINGAAEELDKANQLSVEYELAEETLADATSRLQGLSAVRETMESARQFLTDPETGESRVPTNLEEIIDTLSEQIGTAQRQQTALVREAESEYDEAVEEVVGSGQYLSDHVSKMYAAAEDAGGEQEDARALTLMVYQQDLREFGIALRLLEKHNEGVDPAAWFTKYLKTLSPEAREDFMGYIRSHYKRKEARTFTRDEALSFFGENGKRVKTKFNAWVKTKRKPDQLSVRQLRSFIAKDIKDPELAAQLVAAVKVEEQQDISDEFVLKNFVDRMMLDIAPEPGNTSKWVTSPDATARPRSLNQIVTDVTRRYRDAARDGKQVKYDSIHATSEDEEGNEYIKVDAELAQALEDAWKDNSTSLLVAELSQTEFFVRVLKAIERSPAAQDSIRRLAGELGVSDPNGKPLAEVWMATHETILRNPESFVLLGPDMQRAVRSLYGAGLGRAHDFGSAETIHNNLDENRFAYVSRLKKAGVEGDSLVDDGLFNRQTKQLAEYMVETDDVLSAERRQIFRAVVDFINARGTWPDVTFLTSPAAAYAQYTGSYAHQTGTIYLNLTKKDLNHGETILRGLLQHVMSTVEPGTDGLADLQKAADVVLKQFPGTAGVVTNDLAPDVDSAEDVVRFALNDPVVFHDTARRNPTWVDRVTNGLAKILGLRGPVAHNRLRPIVVPKPGQVWGAEPKQGRHTAGRTPATRSSKEILEDIKPQGVTIIPSTDYTQSAWVSTSAPDKVFVNLETIEATLGDLSPEPREQILRAILNHELAHLASLSVLTDADRQAILTDMTAADFEKVRARVPGGTGGIEYAEEYLRMKVEESVNGLDSDAFIKSVLNYGSGFRARLVRYVETFLNKLRGLVVGRPSIGTAVHIQRVTDALAAIQRGGMDLRPVPTTDIDGHWAALSELEEGTERTFFSVPVHSTDGSSQSRLSKLLRASKIRGSLKEIDNQVAFVRNTMEAVVKDFHNKVKAAAKRGVVINEDQINAALGSTDSYITEQQEAQLRAARQADVDAKLSPDVISSNHTARLLTAQRARVLQREAEQKAALESLARADAGLAKDVKYFRDNITEMSRKVGQIHDGGALKAVFDSRANIHLVRSYEFFNSRAWVDAAIHAKDDKGVKGYKNVPFNSLRSQAIKDVQNWYARKGTTIDGKRAYQVLTSWLNELSGLRPEVLNLNTLTKAGSLFESKEEIPAGVRALLGEHAAINSAANTTFKLGTYLAKHDAAADVRKMLLGQGWAFDSPKSAPGLVPLWESVQGDTEYEALQGLYATPDDKIVIEETLSTMLPTRGKAADDLGSAAGSAIKKFFGASLTLKTLYSVGFFTRNEGSNSLYLLPMQGLWGAMLNAGRFGKGIAGSRAANIAWGGLGVRRFAEGEEEYTIELLRNGIIHDDVTVGLLRDLNGANGEAGSIQEDIQHWAAGNKPKGWIAKIVERIAKAEGIKDTALAAMSPAQQVTTFLSRINEVIDAKAKIQLYELELDTLKEVRNEVPDWSNKSDEELQRMAAAKVHATMQGHSQVWGPVKQFTGSNIGMMIAPFARFKGEIVRIMVNTPKLAWSEWAEGKRIGSQTLKRRAMRRALSFGIVNTVWSSLLVSLFGALFDALDDERKDEGKFVPLTGETGKALRMGLPKWSRNHTIYARRNKDGTVTTFDMTYYNPLSLTHDPFKIFWDKTNTDGLDAGISGFVDAMATDFIGEGIGPGAVRQILSNSDDYGRDIFLPSDDVGTKTEKILRHYFENALEPALKSKSEQVFDSIVRKDKAKDGERFYDASNIIIGELVGVRPRDYIESEMMKRSARSTKLDLDRVQALLSPLNSPAWREPEEIEEAIHEHITAYTDLWKQHRRNSSAWAEFTGDEKAVREYAQRMVDAGHSKDRTRKAMLRGVVDRPVRSRQGIENIVNSGNTSGAEGGKNRARVAVDTWLQYPRFISLTD